MLRYSEWNVVPIWFLYSSVLIVVRCADLVPVFFDTYRNILYQSDISGQNAQSASIPRMFFPVGWKRQPEEGSIGPGFLRYLQRNILYQSDISGQDAQSASVTCSVFFLSVGSVSQRKVASGRAAAEEG